MDAHRLINLRRSSAECSCREWAIHLDRSVTLHGDARSDYLMDAWERHRAEESARVAKEAPGVTE